MMSKLLLLGLVGSATALSCYQCDHVRRTNNLKYFHLRKLPVKLSPPLYQAVSPLHLLVMGITPNYASLPGMLQQG